MSNGIKIATIGGGSSYTPELVEGFIKRYENLPVDELWLVDIPEGQDKLDTVGALAQRMVKRAGLPTKVVLTTDRRAALEGADFVTTQVRIGRLPARVLDERIPLSHGMLGQETNGAGGMFKAFRTIPVILDFVREVQELCPKAWMVNFSNPSGMIEEAILNYTDFDRAIGLCNVPINMHAGIARVLGVDESRLELQLQGVNHFVFATDVFVDGVWHKRSWGGSVENVSVLVAIGVNAEGHREVIGVTEGMREDAASWEQFIRSMIERGLKGVRLVVGDRCAGLVSTVNSMLPRAKYQRCMVHFMRNVLSKVPPNHRDWASAALKAIFAMESRESALAKAGTVAAEMESRKLKAAAGCLREGIGETTAYLLPEFPTEHRRRIRTNNMIERLNREIRRRTRVVGGFPDGNSALMLVCARIRYVTANEWSTRRYLDMSRLDDNLQEAN